MADILGIHPDHAGVELVAETKGARDVGGPDISGEPVLHVIGDGERLGLVLEGYRRQDRAEYLLLRDAHLVVGLDKQRRRHIAAAARTLVFGAAGGDLRAFGGSDRDVVQHLLFMNGMDERTDDCGGIKRVPHLDAPGLLGHKAREGLVDAFLDEQTRGRGAAFAVQRIDHEDRGVGGAFEIGVREHHDRVLAAEFEMNTLQRVGALFHDH